MTLIEFVCSRLICYACRLVDCRRQKKSNLNRKSNCTHCWKRYGVTSLSPQSDVHDSHTILSCIFVLSLIASCSNTPTATTTNKHRREKNELEQKHKSNELSTAQNSVPTHLNAPGPLLQCSGRCGMHSHSSVKRLFTAFTNSTPLIYPQTDIYGIYIYIILYCMQSCTSSHVKNIFAAAKRRIMEERKKKEVAFVHETYIIMYKRKPFKSKN